MGHVSRTILAKHIPIDLKVGDLETTQLTNVGERWNAGFRKGGLIALNVAAPLQNVRRSHEGDLIWAMRRATEANPQP